MENVLVKWSSNWADQMDIEGFSILKVTAWEEYKKKLRVRSSFRIYIGTEEYIDYASGEDLLEEIKVKKLSAADEKSIRKMLGSQFGNQNFLYVLSEEGRDEDFVCNNLIPEDYSE